MNSEREQAQVASTLRALGIILGRQHKEAREVTLGAALLALLIALIS